MALKLDSISPIAWQLINIEVCKFGNGNAVEYNRTIHTVLTERLKFELGCHINIKSELRTFPINQPIRINKSFTHHLHLSKIRQNILYDFLSNTAQHLRTKLDVNLYRSICVETCCVSHWLSNWILLEPPLFRASSLQVCK